MDKRIGLILLILSLSCSAIASEQKIVTNNQVYTVGIVPQFDTRRTIKIWRPILDDLQKRTGLRFTLRGSATIPAFEQEIKAGAFDFVYMNPYLITRIKNKQGYIPLVRDVGRSLHGILVVLKDSPIQSVKELAGKTIAFPAPNALGATLLTRSELSDQHQVSIIPHYVRLIARFI